MQLLNALPNFTVAHLLTTSHFHTTGKSHTTELGSLLTCNVVQKQIKQKNTVPKKYVLLNSVWLDGEADDFKHFYKLKRFGQLRYWVIEYIPSESWTFKMFKIRRFGTELHGTSQGFGGKFIPSLPASPGLFRRSGASAPSAPISLPWSQSSSIAVCFMASATTCSSETGARQRPPAEGVPFVSSSRWVQLTKPKHFTVRNTGSMLKPSSSPSATGAKYVPAMYVIQLYNIMITYYNYI